VEINWSELKHFQLRDTKFEDHKKNNPGDYENKEVYSFVYGFRTDDVSYG
jgi:hypothetical protein